MTQDQHAPATGPIAGGPAARIASLSETPDAPVVGVFSNPMDVVEARDSDYGARLDILQRWRAEVASDAAALSLVASAIGALEGRAAQDETAPDDGTPYGYGVQHAGSDDEQDRD